MKRLALIVFILIVATSVAFILPQEKLSGEIKIGVSDDISGFVVDYMIKDEQLDIDEELEAYFIKDC